LGPNSDNLNLNPTGGVGINNDDPQFNLDVSGNANVTNKLISKDASFNGNCSVSNKITSTDALFNGNCIVSNKLISKDVSFNGNVSINNKGDNLNASILSLIYPVGAIYSHYLSGVVTTAVYNATNPSVLMKWSNSTWVSIDPNNGYGVSLVSGNPANSANGFNNFGDISGYAQIPSHSHQWNNKSGSWGALVPSTSGSYYAQTYNAKGTLKDYSDAGSDHYTDNAYTSTDVLNDASNSNYHPYVVVAMWRRTA
jgi:hypothetical protein